MSEPKVSVNVLIESKSPVDERTGERVATIKYIVCVPSPFLEDVEIAIKAVGLTWLVISLTVAGQRRISFVINVTGFAFKPSLRRVGTLSGFLD